MERGGPSTFMQSPDDKVTYFGQTDYRGKRIKFGIKEQDRWKHMYVIGKTGMGKSTMLENLAVQDIQNGEGVCFIDPHGGSAELLLSYVPEHRIKDVVYFAPFDYEHPIALNVMEDIGRDKRPLVASGLIGAMKKVWVDAWSPRMEYLLANALLALLEFPNSTLLGVNRMFADKDYRAMVVANTTDPSVRAFWIDEFAKYSDKFATEATAAIQNKIGQFAANPLIRNIVGQAVSSFDIRKIMDERKIFIINLSKGRIGEGNANLLGSMLITKIYLSAMSRADTTPETLKALPPFYLYVDEFQSFANESFADILSEARKYKLALTIAHQYIEQMSEEVRAAVFGNVGTMVAFRVGAYDAEVLEKEFAPTFEIEDIVNLGARQIYLKLMINGQGSAPFSATTLPPIAPLLQSFAVEVVEASRKQFARPRAVVEEEIKKWHEPVPPPPRDPNAPPETRKYAPGTRPPSNYGDRPRSFESPRPGDSTSRAPRPYEGGGQRFDTPRPSYDAPAPRPTGPSPDLGSVIRAAGIAPDTSAEIPSPRPTMVVPVKPPAEVPAAPPPPPLAVPRRPDVSATVPVPVPPPAQENFVRAQTLPIPPASIPQSSVPTPSPTYNSTPQRPRMDSGRRDGPVRDDRPRDDRRGGERRSPSPGRPFSQEHARPDLGGSRTDQERDQRRDPRDQNRAPLAMLKSDAKKDKGPSEENLSSLKAALMRASAERQNAASEPAPRPTTPTSVPTSGQAAPPPRPTPPPFFPKEGPVTNAKEVPESVLRGILGQ